jgi:hypothetical protein
VSFSPKTKKISLKIHFDQSEMKFVDFVPKKTFQLEFSQIFISNRFENNDEEEETEETFLSPPTSPHTSNENDEIETNFYLIRQIENDGFDRISMKINDFQLNLFDKNSSRSIIDKFSSRFHFQMNSIETFSSFQNENFLWAKITDIQLDFCSLGQSRRFNRQNFDLEIQLKSNKFLQID